MARVTRCVLLAVAMLALTGCSGASTLPLVSDVGLPKIHLMHALRIEEVADHPGNLVEHALSACDQRIEAGETACLRKAVDQAHLSIPALIKLLPGCRLGQVCHYAYTTQDVVGLYSGTAAHYTVHWRADVDLTHRPVTTDAVPITVKQLS